MLQKTSHFMRQANLINGEWVQADSGKTVDVVNPATGLVIGTVPYSGREPVGTILINKQERFLYYIEDAGRAIRFGVAVGRDGQKWSGEATVGRRAKWPTWTPTANMRRRNPSLPVRVAGGPQNPLGARALYLYRDGRDTLYRIHGTNEPWSIGAAASSGCIRMLNEHVFELFGTVRNGARVIVL